MRFSSIEFGVICLISVSVGIILVGLFDRMRTAQRKRKYLKGFHTELCQAIGHYRGTVEAIVANEVSGERAVAALKNRPVFDVPNVGEFKPTVTVAPALDDNIEDVYVTMEGPTKLLEFIYAAYLKSNEIVVTNCEQMECDRKDECWQRISISVFDSFDAVAIETLRDLLSRS